MGAGSPVLDRDPEVSGWDDDDASPGTKSGGILEYLRDYDIPYTSLLSEDRPWSSKGKQVSYRLLVVIGQYSKLLDCWYWLLF